MLTGKYTWVYIGYTGNLGKLKRGALPSFFSKKLFFLAHSMRLPAGVLLHAVKWNQIQVRCLLCSGGQLPPCTASRSLWWSWTWSLTAWNSTSTWSFWSLSMSCCTCFWRSSCTLRKCFLSSSIVTCISFSYTNMLRSNGFWVYPFLDWAQGPVTAGWYIGIGAAFIVVFFIQYAFHWFRGWLGRRFGRHPTPPPRQEMVEREQV